MPRFRCAARYVVYVPLNGRFWINVGRQSLNRRPWRAYHQGKMSRRRMMGSAVHYLTMVRRGVRWSSSKRRGCRYGQPGKIRRLGTMGPSVVGLIVVRPGARWSSSKRRGYRYGQPGKIRRLGTMGP